MRWHQSDWLVKSSPPAYWMKELSSLSHTLFSRQSISERRSLCVSCLIITGGKNHQLVALSLFRNRMIYKMLFQQTKTDRKWKMTARTTTFIGVLKFIQLFRNEVQCLSFVFCIHLFTFIHIMCTCTRGQFILLYAYSYIIYVNRLSSKFDPILSAINISVCRKKT